MGAGAKEKSAVDAKTAQEVYDDREAEVHDLRELASGLERANGDLQAQLEELRATREVDELREQAQKVKADASYSGALTPQILDKLQALLEAAIPGRYIATIEAWSLSFKKGGEDKPWPPFTMTGVKNPQVQVDRMNAVLGRGHWRALRHYQDAGQLCHVFVVIGNNLGQCEVKEGQLVTNESEVIAIEDGWGGYSRGAARGDHYKGSETNAIKRVLARLGPGSEIYRLDADTDVNPDSTEAPPPQAVPRPAPAQDPEKELTALLAGDDADELVQARRELDALMKELDVDATERLRMLKGAGDKERELEKLKARATAALAGAKAEQQPAQTSLS